jgi:hypothetical protein
LFADALLAQHVRRAIAPVVLIPVLMATVSKKDLDDRPSLVLE